MAVRQVKVQKDQVGAQVQGLQGGLEALRHPHHLQALRLQKSPVEGGHPGVVLYDERPL